MHKEHNRNINEIAMEDIMQLKSDRPLDIIMVGRAGIDFNTVQVNCPFARIESFTKSVGGSPANIAQGTARMGLKTGFIGKVSGDGMGDYVIETFRSAGIDVGGMMRDQTGAKNCLAITEVLSPSRSGSYLYREGTADLLLAPEEISEEYIRSAASVLISGTALSRSPSREAVFAVIEYARRCGATVMMDIDFRPSGWRDPAETAVYYSLAAEKCDIILGNREEFNAVEFLSMPDNRDDRRSAEAFLGRGAQLVLVKDGADGSCAYTAEGEVIRRGIIPAEVKKSFGSGDAYAAGLVSGLFRGTSLAESMELGTACAAMVLCGAVSCADALPTLDAALRFLGEHPLAPFRGNGPRQR
jgi:5-dehydro-2-deoxygluconokinase